MGHDVLYSPAVSKSNIFNQFVRDTPQQRAAFIHNYSLNIQPVSDDRPFFFLTTRARELWRNTLDLLLAHNQTNPGRVRNVPPPAGVLTGIAVAVILLLLAFAILVYSWLPVARISEPQMARSWLYFAFTGFGTLLGETGLFQLGTFLLGMPFLAVSVVLAAMLLGAGLGAGVGASRRRTVVIAAVLMLLATLIWESKLILSWPPPEILTGAMILAALSGGFGYFTGSFYPAGLCIFQMQESRTRRAHAFAVSSAFSVAGAAAGPVSAILCGTSMLFGASTIILFGAAAVLSTRRSLPSGILQRSKANTSTPATN